MRKLDIFLLILFFILICFSDRKVIAQSFQMLYAKQIQFEYNGAGVILQPGVGNKAGVNTVTIPDETGTIDTSANNYSRLMIALKALDSSHGSHSGVNWQSFGY